MTGNRVSGTCAALCSPFTAPFFLTFDPKKNLLQTESKTFSYIYYDIKKNHCIALRHLYIYIDMLKMKSFTLGILSHFVIDRFQYAYCDLPSIIDTRLLLEIKINFRIVATFVHKLDWGTNMLGQRNKY